MANCTCGPNRPVSARVGVDMVNLHQWNCPLNLNSPMAAAERAANRTVMVLEDRAKTAIQALIRAELETLRVEHDAIVADLSRRLLALETGGGRATEPAPSPDSWSGASVVPRGSSNPPPPPLCEQCEETRARSKANGYLGFVLCGSCSAIRGHACLATDAGSYYPSTALGPDMLEGGLDDE